MTLPGWKWVLDPRQVETKKQPSLHDKHVHHGAVADRHDVS